MKFTEFNLDEKVLKGIDAAQFEEAMPVQEKVFGYSLQGRDVLVQSHTGSGKTAAFLVTIFDRFVKQETPIKALIIVPTRELADQIEDDAKLLASGIPNIKIASFFGGMGYHQQDKAVNEGVDLFIGTPGRLIDFQSTKKIDFKSLDIVIIDEADRLFDMGFLPDIKKMLSKMRPPKERQTMLFSATLSTRVRHLAWEFMNSPATVEIEAERITVEDIKQGLFHVSRDDKFKLLLHLIKDRNPETALIFTNTRHRAVEVAKRLQINGYQSQFLMGDLPQRKRLKVINSMKDRQLRFLVATDVAARGLHINDLSLVVNYDIPEDFENYVHRIGRTARAGKSGSAVSFACEQFVYGLEAIEKYINMKIPVEWHEPLDQVADKSSDVPVGDLRYRAKQDRGGSSQPSRGPKGPRKRKPREQERRTPTRPKISREHPVTPAAPPPRSKKPYRPVNRPAESPDIQALPLEERIAIYKNKYGASLERDAGKKSPPKRKQDRPDAPEKHNQQRNVEKNVQEPMKDETQKAGKKKSKGLFSKLFRRG